jgi:O-antigen/teichoic acid export membrane protein
MSIGKNIAYNLAGFLIPTALALATVPAYISLIGAARYGVLSLVWLILGYFGLFDLGLGRATTQRIAALQRATPEERAIAFHTALVTNLLIGAVGSLVLWLASYIAFSRLITMSPALRVEAIQTAPLLALALPVATTLGVLSGALIGRERFRLTNQISVSSTALFQLLPLFVAWKFSTNLPHLVIASLVARCVGLLALYHQCRREFATEGGVAWDRQQLRRLLGYGSWMTLSSMIGPLLTFTDRFMIGGFLGPVAVTIYTVPMEAMRRLSGIAGSLANALFPRFANAAKEEAQDLARYGTGLLYGILTPAVAGGVVLMEPVMVAWLGRQVGEQATPIARVFLLAFWFNTFVQIPYTRLQANGRPDLVSKIMAAELLPYAAATYFVLARFGLIGGAWTFFVRMVIDGLLLFHVADVGFPRRGLIFGTLFALLALALIVQGTHLSLQFALIVGFIAGIGAAIPATLVLPRDLRRRVPLLEPTALLLARIVPWRRQSQNLVAAPGDGTLT